MIASFGRSQSQSYFTTGGLQPISSSWLQAPWDPRPVILFFNRTLAVLSLCNILSAERMGLSFTLLLALASVFILRFETPPTWRARSVFIFPGTGWLCYTHRHWVPFPSPLTTRRATVEVFDLASIRDSLLGGAIILWFDFIAFLVFCYMWEGCKCKVIKFWTIRLQTWHSTHYHSEITCIFYLWIWDTVEYISYRYTMKS
jgi:hypothetical protein